MNPSKTIPSLLIKENKYTNLSDQIIVEAPLQININGNPLSVTMRTPGHDIFLTIGFLFNEDLLSNIDQIESIEELKKSEDEEIFAVIVKIPDFENPSQSRKFISNSSCGLCGKEFLSEHYFKNGKLNSNFKINPIKIQSLINIMQDKQTLFNLTGGCHAVAIFDNTYNFMCLFEDVGRHNAVDKAAGYLLKNNTINDAQIMLISGRLSFEILAKAYQLKITHILAVSSPTSLSIELAETLGICIAGFCRQNRITIFSCKEKILTNDLL
ncbi:MAG: formate dehydrogenase family accessory protein FdhD [Planctomycetota bacterium]|nr:MAG: formate dehydrogenase family accessory protein FdhD [Planctomycetota bacterium]